MSAENLDNASMEDFRNVAAEAVEQRRRAEGAEARAEAAERKVAAVKALANEWDRVSRGGEDHIRTCTCVRDPLHPELPRCARCIVAEAAMDLRAALDTAAEPDTHAPTRRATP